MIVGINHIGIGVNSIETSEKFFKRAFNFKMPLSDAEYEIWELEQMFKRKPRMRIKNILNPNGGPALELFEHKDTKPRHREKTMSWSDTGILELGIEVTNIKGFLEKLGKEKNISILTDVDSYIAADGSVFQYAYLNNLEGILVQLIDKSSEGKRIKVCGIHHIGIGVRSLDEMRDFYSTALGFNKVVAEVDVDRNLAEQVMDADGNVKWLYLTKSDSEKSEISSFDGGTIKLIYCKADNHYDAKENLRFGDVGIYEIGVEVSDVHKCVEKMRQEGTVILVEPIEFDHGFGPKGVLAYIEDAEGNIIELTQLKSFFKLPPKVLDKIIVKPLQFLSKLGII